MTRARSKVTVKVIVDCNEISAFVDMLSWSWSKDDVKPAESAASPSSSGTSGYATCTSPCDWDDREDVGSEDKIESGRDDGVVVISLISPSSDSGDIDNSSYDCDDEGGSDEESDAQTESPQHDENSPVPSSASSDSSVELQPRRRRVPNALLGRRLIIDSSSSSEEDDAGSVAGESTASGTPSRAHGDANGAGAGDSDASTIDDDRSVVPDTPNAPSTSPAFIDLCTPSPKEKDDAFRFSPPSSTDKENMARENVATPMASAKAKTPLTARYRKFRSNRNSLAKKAAREFNESAFGGRLPYFEVFYNARLRTTAGITRCSRNADGSRYCTVELSDKVVDSIPRMRATLLHEMCHVAAWILDGTCKPPHGAAFKKWARAATSALGIAVTTRHSYAIFKKHAYACVDCGAAFRRHSKSIDVSAKVCGRCGGRISYEGAVDRDSGTAAPARQQPRRAITPYNAFVKENFKRVAAKNRTTPCETMKTLSQMWREKLKV